MLTNILFLILVTLTHAEQVSIMNMFLNGPNDAIMRENALAFNVATGHEINMIDIPLSEMGEEIDFDFRSKSHRYDAFTGVVGLIPTLAQQNLIIPLQDLSTDQTIDPDEDVLINIRNLMLFDGGTYAVPNDGNARFVYYRRDVLASAGADPPATWKDVLALAKQLNGTDMNGDGVGDFGLCMDVSSDTSGYMLVHFFSSMLQQNGRKGGTLFDVDTFTPRLSGTNADQVRLLEVFGEMLEYVPSREYTQLDARLKFNAGECALLEDWADTGKDHIGTPVDGFTGTVPMMGSEVVYSPRGDRINCTDTPTECPYSLVLDDGRVVSISSQIPAGFVGGFISALTTPEKQQVAFDYFKFCETGDTALDAVLRPGTGIEPYKRAHFDVELWVERAEANRQDVSEWLEAMNTAFTHPNYVSEYNFARSHEYMGVMLTKMHLFVRGELSAKGTLDEIYEEWEEVTETNGRQDMVDTYRYSLRLPQIDWEKQVVEEPPSIVTLLVPFIAIGAVCLIASVLYRKNRNALKKLGPLVMSFMSQGFLIAMRTTMELVDIVTDAIAFFTVLEGGKRSHMFMGIYSAFLALATISSFVSIYVHLRCLQQARRDAIALKDNEPPGPQKFPSSLSLNLEVSMHKRERREIMATFFSALCEDLPMLSLTLYIMFGTDDGFEKTVVASTMFNVLMLKSKLSSIAAGQTLMKLINKVHLITEILKHVNQDHHDAQVSKAISICEEIEHGNIEPSESPPRTPRPGEMSPMNVEIR